jgi:hypothetical protein
VLPSESPSCACGWQTETVSEIVGRIDDVLYALDGRALGRLDIVLKKIEGVLEAQLVQDAPNHLLVNLVPVASRLESVETVLEERLKDLFGAGMLIDFSWVSRIPRTAAGKFRYQVNLMGSESRAPGEPRATDAGAPEAAR